MANLKIVSTGLFKKKHVELQALFQTFEDSDQLLQYFYGIYALTGHLNSYSYFTQLVYNSKIPDADHSDV